MTGGAGVDGSEVWMRSIAWIPWNYVQYLVQISQSNYSHNYMYRNTNNTCASVRVKKKCLLSPGSEKIRHFSKVKAAIYIR